MKRRYFIIAALFLFNPIISVFDIFPDVIGYLLIMKGLSEASYVFDNADETKLMFKTMSVVSVFKLICLIILPFTDATMALVFSFSFAILEFIFGISAYQKLFDTISYVYLRCGEESSIPKCEKLKKFTVIFFIVRIICSTVPDLFALFLSDPQKSWMYRFRMLFFILLTIVALIFGIIWLARTVSFFKKTLTDDVKTRISESFIEEMKDRQSVFFSKDFIFAISLISLAMLFTIDFYIDKIEILSDIIFAPMLMFAFIFLIKKKHVLLQKYEKLVVFVLGIHFVSSIMNIIFTVRYDNRFLITSVIRNPNARKLYVPVQASAILTAISFFCIVLLVVHLLKKYTLQRIYENPRFFSEYSVDGFVKEFSGEVKKKSTIVIVFAVISSVSSIMYPFVIPYKEEYVVFDTLLAVGFCIAFMSFASYVNDTIFKKILKYS